MPDLKGMKNQDDRLRELETPAFNEAYAALSRDKCRLKLITVGQVDSYLRLRVSEEAALAWRAYKALEDAIY
jgi:hypothetical protein